VELRQLRYFVEIADRGSFTRAAEQLAIAQPALTAQMHKLEAELGTQLLIRSKRGIALTEVGRIVHEHARRTLDAADATVRAAQIAGEAAGARLAIGYTRIFPFFSIARTLRRLRRDHPNLRFDLREMWSGDQVDALRRGSLDVAFVHQTFAPPDDLEYVAVAEESLTAVVSDRHPLAARRQVTLGRLADEDFVLPSADGGDSVREAVVAACRRAGFQPRIVQETSDFRLLLGLVSAGMGTALISSATRGVRVRGVHYVSIVPRYTLRFAALYRRGPAGTMLAPYLERLEHVTPEHAGFEL
jgi:DNA-binding transcriptional LysR family regulator